MGFMSGGAGLLLMMILAGVSMGVEFADRHVNCPGHIGLRLSDGQCESHGLIRNARITRFCYGCFEEEHAQIDCCSHCPPVPLSIQHSAHCNSHDLGFSSVATTAKCGRCQQSIVSQRVGCATCQAAHPWIARLCSHCLGQGRAQTVLLGQYRNFNGGGFVLRH
ncbi:hypothetical protein PGT21_021881 [Puccinia graminis f. sp. tritici]|uniref:Uncharacterized protein n=1 Tax=Puccinia graminis f. sp. tritici TaxID=56615 RepID=A0A5B0LL74_PUCGR|nr:hypothetical protein PGT21_021881 [Puccinia graminis f. sp. tritici]KAA1112425.1 hypothetical protein PGTUg99_002805 [Puccinia graminis f. sp. tritici]